MKNTLEALLVRVATCVQDLSPGSIADLSSALEIAPDWNRFAHSGAVRSHAWAELRRAAMDCQCSPTRTADFLRAAAAMQQHGGKRPACEVAWTGPAPPLSSLRRTEQALLEVIDSARREIWLVSFATYHVPSIQSALLAAATRGCRVRLLLESTAESNGKLSSGGADSLPPELASHAEIYVWPREQRAVDDRGRFGTLHAKFAVADGELLFVGSANLTEFAFELNIELGLLVRGVEAPRSVEDQLRWLVDARLIERV